MMKQPTLTLIYFFLLANIASLPAQSQIQGIVLEHETGEPVLFGTVALYKYGVLITGTETDFDGVYGFSDITPGLYHLEVTYVGLQRERKEIEIRQDKVYQMNFFMKLENMGSCGIVTTSCSIFDPPLFSLDQLTQGTILYPNRRPEGKTYVLFKDKRSRITGKVKGDDHMNDLKGELRIYKKNQLMKIHHLSRSSKFIFYSMRRGKYRVEVNAIGYKQQVMNIKLRGGRNKEMNINLEKSIEI